MNVLGRDSELAQIDQWLISLEQQSPPGQPDILEIEGLAGIGKTTLWAEAINRARLRQWQVLACRPARSDAGLAHVGLADLLRPVPDEVFASLPSPQRRPLEVALLREEAGEGDLEPRAVGTGLTGLLRGIAGPAPLILAIDDVQWLDLASARAVAFALRRLDDRQVGLLVAIRTEDQAASGRDGPLPLDALCEGNSPARIQVGPLSVAAIHQIFRQALGRSFPRPVLVRIHQAAAGNPFYALEIGRELARVGAPAPGQPLPFPVGQSELTLLRLRRLPHATRDVLAVVAATPRPSADLLDLDALAPAERAGIVRVHPGGRVEFAHPLFGSALYASLPEATRRGLHRDLAERSASLEERARHLALAAGGPDPATADELDRAAAAASARGAADEAVELKELACRLTPPDDRQALVRRKLELAERRYLAGDPTSARQELERSLSTLPPGEDRAQVLLELGSVLWTQGEAEGGLALMSRALGEATTQSLRARIHSRISAFADDCDLSVEHGEAALKLLDEHEDPVLYSFALHNVALFKLYAGKGADHEAIDKGMRLQQDAAAWELSTVPAYWARNFDQFDLARERFDDLLRAFKERGDEASSSGVLTHLAVIDAMTGHMDRAMALAQDAFDLAEQTEQGTFLLMALWAKGQVCTRAGALGQARAAAQEMLRRLDELPDIVLECMARAVLGSAAVMAGNLAEADRQLSRVDDIEEFLHEREPISNRFHGDHAEAVIGLGDMARAEVLVSRMEARATALPIPWIQVVSARSRGLLNAARGDLDQALADYQRALTAHEGLDMPSELGRTLLAMGRLYRRKNERQLAQDYLGRAAAVFESAGAAGWLALAKEELGRARGRRGSGEQLTATEQKICELAVAGLRNTEIAARLFISAKTVEANLSRSYRKLGVRSRTELAARVAADRRDNLASRAESPDSQGAGAA